jgi:hypothetical protein
MAVMGRKGKSDGERSPSEVRTEARRAMVTRMATRAVTITGLCGLALGAGSSAASAHRVYMECDRALTPLYPAVLVAPHKCNLGLRQSYYDVQPVPGRRFATGGLREMHWYNWGQRRAFGHGLACNIFANGGTKWGQCSHVTVKVFRPVSVGPAGGAYIYQRTEVIHSQHDRWGRFRIWFEPGTDY